MTFLSKLNASIIAAERNTLPRNYLGMSEVGDPCLRKTWFKWRWAAFEVMPGRVLRLLSRGHAEEARIIGFLREAGYKITQQQREFVCFNGHFRGHWDGKIYLHEKAVLEIKTHNNSNFSKLKKTVKIAFYKHYVQTQLYMHYSGLKLALYIGINKNNDALYIEFIKKDKQAIKGIIEKVIYLLETSKPPQRVSTSSDYWLCRYCTFMDICWYGAIPNRTCRMCVHSFPDKNCTWQCRKKRKTISEKKQLKGCKKWECLI